MIELTYKKRLLRFEAASFILGEYGYHLSYYIAAFAADRSVRGDITMQGRSKAFHHSSVDRHPCRFNPQDIDPCRQHVCIRH
jgi:hypothetical protein